MSFRDYIAAAHAGINAHELALERAWARHDSWLLRNERALRIALIAILLLWPFGADGRLRRGVIDEIRERRREANRRLRQFEDDALRWFVGEPELAADEMAGFAGGYFERMKAWASRFRQTDVVEAFVRAQKLTGLLSSEGFKGLFPNGRPPSGPSGGGPQLTPGGPSPTTPPRSGPPLLPAPAQPIELPTADFVDLFNEMVELGFDPPGSPLEFWSWVMDHRAEIDAARRRRDDVISADIEESALEEQIQNGVSNPKANISYETRRWIEHMKDLSMGRPLRSEVIEWVNGVANPSATTAATSHTSGIVANRQNLRLSTEAHVRAIFRSEIVRWAEDRGIRHFLLEMPMSRRDSVRPAGAIAQHAHMLRTLDEWRAIMREANLGRRGSPMFENLGLHHGDFTVPIPVPAMFLPDARAYATTARAALARRLKEAA